MGCFRLRYLLALPISAISLVLPSCGNPSKPVEITETREAPPVPPATEQPDLAAIHGGKMPSAPPADSTPQREYKWTAPEGWAEAPASPMRIANFRIGEDKQTECYLTVLKGTGGGTEMNINRWRGQMGVNEVLDAEAIGKLPKVSMLGKEVPLVETPGTYAGMSGETKSGYMLLGAICELGDESVFAKMIGPENVVKGERDKFIAFCGSLK